MRVGFNFIKDNFASLIPVLIALIVSTGVEFGFTMAGISMLVFGALIEEGMKYFSLLVFKPDMRRYVWTTAWTFGILELVGAFFNGTVNRYYGFTQLAFLMIRSMPHFIFAAMFLWGAEKSKTRGFLYALAAHTLWNLSVLLL